MFCKIVVLKYFAKFRGKHLCWGPFLGKLQVSNTSTCLTILKCFYKYLLYEASTGCYFWNLFIAYCLWCKSFTIAIPIFLLLSFFTSLIAVFRESFWQMFLLFAIKDAWNQNQTHFIGYTEKCFHKNSVWKLLFVMSVAQKAIVC